MEYDSAKNMVEKNQTKTTLERNNGETWGN